MKRCPKCGLKCSDNAKFCGHCGYKFPVTTTSQQASHPKSASLQVSSVQKGKVTSISAKPTSFHSGTTPSVAASQTPIPIPFGSIFGRISTHFIHPQPQLEGNVISVDPPYDEPPDPDFAKLCVGILVAITLIPILLAAFIGFIFLALILTFLRLGALLTTLNPLNLLALLAIFGIGRRAKDQQVPVRNFRLRDADGNEYQIRMKGHLQTGDIIPADKLTIWGKWKDGTLIFKKAYNHRTQSEVKLKQSVWPKIVLGIVGFFILTYLLSHLGGSP